MEKLTKIIENIIAPKPEFKIGQVWNCQNMWHVITDVSLLNLGIVRTCVLGEDNFGDKHDVILLPKDYINILTRKHSVLRITDGAIKTKYLISFMFSLREKDIKKIIKSLSNTDYQFEPMQELVIAKYLNKLNKYRLAAFESIL